MRNKYKGQDIKSRLGNTVIRYKDKPVLCEANADGSVLNVFSIANRELIASIEPDDEDIDISSITLGYANSGPPYNCAIYISRLPRRMYKQGLDLNYLNYQPLSRSHNSIDWNYLFNPAFEKSLLGYFPTFAKAIASISTGGHHSVALTKEVAVFRDKDTLKYYVKGVESGFASMKTPNQVTIPDDNMAWVNRFLISEIKDVVVAEGFSK